VLEFRQPIEPLAGCIIELVFGYTAAVLVPGIAVELLVLMMVALGNKREQLVKKSMISILHSMFAAMVWLV